MPSEDDVLQLLQQQIDSLKESRQQQLQLNAERAAQEASVRDAAIKCAQGLVKLDIGGVRYTTSLTTLTAVPESFFTSIFSGDWQQAKTSDGAVFVDRDGELFNHILQYLRAVKDGQDFLLPENLDSTTIAAIAAEAQFYGFTDLQAMLQQFCGRTNSPAKVYEYKYIIVRQTSIAYYAPERYQGGSGEYDTWKHVNSPDSAEIGAEGGLQCLHNQGWELYSHAAGGEFPSISLVFRRKT